jgi:hypothetical protein
VLPDASALAPQAQTLSLLSSNHVIVAQQRRLPRVRRQLQLVSLVKKDVMVTRYDLRGVLEMLYAATKITGLALMRPTDCGAGKNLVEVQVSEGNWEGDKDTQGRESLGVVRKVRVWR